ncbi:MAG: choice-of-anchor D domain-containing protein [Bacteroidota bacterium]
MKTFYLLCLIGSLLFFLSPNIKAQVIFDGCTSSLNNGPYTLNLFGTVVDGGVTRNIYDNGVYPSCGAGVCRIRIIWSITNNRWEVQLDNSGATAPVFTNQVTIYASTVTSQPNPPDLTFGNWQDVSGVGCGAIVQLSGDVQGNLGGSTPEPEIGINTTITDFGGVLLGQSASLGYQIENTGTATLNLTSITSNNTPVFNIQNAPTTISAGAIANFDIVFSPSASGTTSAVIALNSDASNSPTVNFTVTGTGVAPAQITASATRTCPSETVVLTATAGDNYVWSTGETTQSVSVSPAIPTAYSVTVTTATVMSRATLNIQAEDLTPPTVLTRSLTLSLDVSGNASLTAMDLDAGSTDNCGGIASLNASKTEFNCSDLGTNTVTLTALDINGNSASATANVTVVDNNLPEISLEVLPNQAEEDSDFITFVFTFRRTSVGCSLALPVRFSVDGDAIYNEDYYLVRGADTFSSTGGVVTILAGQTEAELVIQVQQDAVAESDETITLTVTP